MSTIFEAGMKVVCIGEEAFASSPFFQQLTFPEILPVVGNIYTIRSVFKSAVQGEIGVTLEEIPDQMVAVAINGMLGIAKCGWSASNFRPLLKRKTDISIFTEMLTPARVEEPA